MRKAYSYLRFSTGGQAAGDSTRRQDDIFARVCREQGWEPCEQFSDRGISGFHGANLDGGLGRFLEAIRVGQIEKGSVLVIEDLDRLSRDEPLEAAALWHKIIKAGVDVYSDMDRKLYTKENIKDTGTLLTAILKMCLAHDESAKKQLRSLANWHKKHLAAKDGKAMATKEGSNRTIPQWLEIKDGKFKPRPDKVAIVRQIFSWCIHGYGLNKITALCNQQFGGMKWNQRTIADLFLTKRVLGEHVRYSYVGKKKTKQDTFPNYYPQIITEDTYYAATAAMASRKGTRGAHGKFVNIFASLIRHTDDQCNIVMMNKTKTTAKKKHEHRYFMSYRGFKGEPNCSKEYFPAAPLEKGLLGILIDLELNLDNNSQKIELQGLEGRLDNIKTNIKVISEEVKDKASKRLVKMLVDLEEEQEKVENKLKALRATRHVPQAEHVKSLIESGNTPEIRVKLRQALRLMIHHIDLWPMEGSYKLQLYLRNGDERSCTLDKNTGEVLGVSASGDNAMELFGAGLGATV